MAQFYSLSVASLTNAPDPIGCKLFDRLEDAIQAAAPYSDIDVYQANIYEDGDCECLAWSNDPLVR